MKKKSFLCVNYSMMISHYKGNQSSTGDIKCSSDDLFPFCSTMALYSATTDGMLRQKMAYGS